MLDAVPLPAGNNESGLTELPSGRVVTTAALCLFNPTPDAVSRFQLARCHKYAGQPVQGVRRIVANQVAEAEQFDAQVSTDALHARPPVRPVRGGRRVEQLPKCDSTFCTH